MKIYALVTLGLLVFLYVLPVPKEMWWYMAIVSGCIALQQINYSELYICTSLAIVFIAGVLIERVYGGSIGHRLLWIGTAVFATWKGGSTIHLYISETE